MKKEIKLFVIFGFGTVLFYLIIVFLLKGQQVIFPVFMISSFLFSLFLNKKQIIYSLSILTFIWIVHFFREESILSNIIIYLIFTPLTFMLGYYLQGKNLAYKALYVFLLVFVGIYGFTNLWFIQKNLNSKKVVELPKTYFLNELNDTVFLDNKKNTVIVLDLWTTTCGVCFEQFPEFDKNYEVFKNNENVQLYALNIPYKNENIEKAKKMIDKYNYKFPKLYALSSAFTDSLGIDRYPHSLIIKNGKVVFSGKLSYDKDVFVNKFQDEVNYFINN